MGIVYAMSDIHADVAAFEEALSLVEKHLGEPDTKLVLCGDYIHGKNDRDGFKVLDRIIGLQKKYGTDTVIALVGNHEDSVIDGFVPIDWMNGKCGVIAEEDLPYIAWMKKLPRYYTEGNTIFVHAGIDESTGENWKELTDPVLFTEKYPAETGKIKGLSEKVVAGHTGTWGFAQDYFFHDIFYDGESHYYIDGSVLEGGYVPVLKVDTTRDLYYQVTKDKDIPVLPYPVPEE